MLHQVLCIHHGDNPIQAIHLLNVIINKEGLCDWSRICHSSCLNQNCVKVLHLLVHPLQSLNQVTTHCAANAAIHDLHNFLIHTLECLLLAVSGGDELFVNADLSKFVFDNCEAKAVVRRAEDVVEQSCLA